MVRSINMSKIKLGSKYGAGGGEAQDADSKRKGDKAN